MQIKPFRLERFFAEHEFTAKYLLCSSDCEAVDVNTILSYEKDSAKRLEQVWLGYTESAGSPTLRNEISKLYANTKPEDILVHSGAEEAIFSFMNSVLTKDDHIIVQYPGYQSSSEVAKSIGCEVTYWKTHEENNWELDLSFLLDNIKSNTKVVYVNFPHNPTGYYPDKNFYNELNKICLDKGIIVFSDEVFHYLEQENTIPLPHFCDINPKAVSLGVMSKSFGLPGLRIGWVATHNKDVFDKMASYKDYLTICNSAPSEFFAELALVHKEKLLARNNDLISNNLSLLDVFFEKHSNKISWVKPKAGPISFPQFKFGDSANSISAKLLKEKGVLLLPGHLYNEDYKMNFRLGFGRKNMPKALELFDDFLSSL